MTEHIFVKVSLKCAANEKITHSIPVENNMAVAYDTGRNAVTREALENIEITVLVVTFGRDDLDGAGIPNNHVAIGTHCDPTLAMIQQ